MTAGPSGIYLRDRYYDASTAQFLTRDPMVAQARSPDAYVNGNPLNATDPSGLDKDYYSSWDLGAATNTRNPSAVLWWLTHHADYEFPFEVHNLPGSYTVHGLGIISGVVSSSSCLVQGQNYALHALGLSNPIHVDFAGMEGGAAVLRLTVLSGHTEGTGSTIRFSSWVTSDAHTHFDVTGHDTFNYDGVPNSWVHNGTFGWLIHGVDSFEVQALWNQLANHVNGGTDPSSE